MKTISMVDLRTHSERIVRELRRGERMMLSYRGELLAELVPAAAAVGKMTPLQALQHAQQLVARDAKYAEKTETYLRQLREDQKTWGEKGSA
jgi:antitoxin (DNA-binding transcriptional repressor) of toxin-antitoxin stability system